jgi:hypothetical protein
VLANVCAATAVTVGAYDVDAESAKMNVADSVFCDVSENPLVVVNVCETFEVADDVSE